MVRRGSQLLHPIQVTEVGYNMACEGLPLIADEVGRCTEQPKIPISQSLGGGRCSLIFHHIHYNVFGEVILYDQHILDNRFLLKRHCFLN